MGILSDRISCQFHRARYHRSGLPRTAVKNYYASNKSRSHCVKTLMYKCVVIFIGLCFISISASTKDDYPELDYYRDGKFVNQQGRFDSDIWAAIKWKLVDNDRQEWPEYVAVTRHPEMVERSVEPRLTFVTHSTFLLQVDAMPALKVSCYFYS